MENENVRIKDPSAGKKEYNPKRFNALDSAIVYLIVLTSWLLFPLFLRTFAGGMLRAVYRFDYYAYMIVSTLLSQALLFLIAFAYCKIRRVNPFSGAGYVAKWDGVQVLMSLLLVAGIMVSFYYTHLAFGEDASDFFGAATVPDNPPTSVLSPLFVLLYLLLTALLPAAVEEMLFRGIVMRGLEQFGGVCAVLCSAVMFSFMHGSFQMMILQFLGGVAIAAVVSVTRNWLLGSAMHFFNNSFTVAVGLMMNHTIAAQTGTKGAYLIGSFTDAVMIAFGVICLTVSVVYFGTMLVGNEKKKVLGGKPWHSGRFYAVKDENGEVALRDATESASFRGDGMTYRIGGKFRENSGKANPTVAAILLGIGILFAFVQIVFQL